ncbi:MAG: DUF1320 domain-containing protein [Candidatus Cloacimonadaceae bacterium]
MYCTQANVEARLGQFAELILSGLEDKDVLAFITEADDIIDGYIAAAVPLPFTSTPKLIAAIATDIAVRNLWAQTQARSVPDHVRYDYENAIKLLEQIAKGILKLEAQDHSADDFTDMKYSAAKRVFRPAL